MQGLYLEEFDVGRKFQHALRRTVTEIDNLLFTCLTHNPQPLHIDHEFAAKSEWGKPLVNSIFTLGLMIGVSVNDTTIGTTVGNLGMTDVRFPKPVFHGDTLNFTTEVLAKRESRSRGDVGIVEFLHKAFNQRGELVAECRRQAMMRKRPKA
jgi:acyl dehydratase